MQTDQLHLNLSQRDSINARFLAERLRVELGGEPRLVEACTVFGRSSRSAVEVRVYTFEITGGQHSNCFAAMIPDAGHGLIVRHVATREISSAELFANYAVVQTAPGG